MLCKWHDFILSYGLLIFHSGYVCVCMHAQWNIISIHVYYIYIYYVYTIYTYNVLYVIYILYTILYLQYFVVCIYNIHIYTSSLSTHLLMDACCCCITELLLYLSYCKHAAMNIVLHVYFQIIVFSGYMPRSGIAGSYGNFIFFLSQGEEKES